jgi:tetratricopeptide (TPR) repeat protein
VGSSASAAGRFVDSVLIGCLAFVSIVADSEPIDDALAALQRKDYATAAALLRPLAEQGNTLARVNLAYLVYEGDGVAADAAQAAKWYRLAAEQSDENAQYNLGVMYENGKGVERDLPEAVKWWQKAARQGYADAQYNLGAMYYTGRGVAKDYVRAYLWKSLAAEGTVTTVPLRRARAGRDAIGAVMTQAQLAQAREMIAACKASDFEDCE